MKFTIFILSFLFVLSAWSAGTAKVSAIRAPNEDWTTRAFKVQGDRELRQVNPPRVQRSGALDVAVALEQVDLSQVTKLPDYKTLQDYFVQVRDKRFLDDQDEKMLRRITWMYPDDGCYARASLINELLVADAKPALTKFFVFGNLEVQSSNAAYGSVSWWYHVAAVASDGNDVYILDPAIEPSRPLKLKEWMGRLGGDPDLTVSACHADAYTPYSDCYKPDAADKSTALDDDTYFLPQEKDRLVLLGRDWQKELGDAPPWLVRTERPKKSPVCSHHGH